MKPERRFSPNAEVRVTRAADDTQRIEGYAAVFFDESDPGTEFKLFDDFVERIMPGAFDGVLSRPDDVRGLFNHDPNQVLGRTASGTMTLSVDAKGLRYSIEPGDTTVAADTVSHIERGDVTGSSFAFIPTDVSFRETAGVTIREIRSVDLFDAGPVTFPAYPASTTGVRSDDYAAIKAEAEQWRADNAAAEFVATNERRKRNVNQRADMVKRGLA